MKTQIYVIDTSAILEIFKIHPPSTYPDFWIKLEDCLLSLLSNGRLIILKWVDKELTDLGYSIEANDPPAVWIKKHEKYIVENSTSVVDAGKKVIREFPNCSSVNTGFSVTSSGGRGRAASRLVLRGSADELCRVS